MKIKTILSGTLVLLLLYSCGSKQEQTTQQTSSKKYPVSEAKKQDVILHSEFPTILKGEVDIEIKPRLTGTIEKVYVDEGTVVKKGHALYLFDSPESKQSLEAAQATYNTAKLDVERMRPLAEKGIISDVLLKSYENKYNSAAASLEKSQASMGWVSVTSPINGTIGTLPYRLGSLVTSSSILTHVANTQNVVAYFSMNEKELLSFLKKWEGNTQAEKIKNMPSVQLILADGSTYEEEGRIETISGVVDSNTGSVNIRASFPNPHGLLRSGTSGKVIIPDALKDVYVIPQKATFSQQDKTLVFMYEDSKAVSRVIKVESTPDGKSYVVLDGIKAGDKIITDGVSTLKSGMEIQVQ